MSNESGQHDLMQMITQLHDVKIYQELNWEGGFSDYLHIVAVSGAGEVAVFTGAMVGAGLGFLWFNCHPAQVFMGDVGSLALGGGLGIVAVVVKQELLLVLVGGLFVLEALSVLIQVASVAGVPAERLARWYHPRSS